MSRQGSMEELYQTVTYKLQDVYYLPHYVIKNFYVSPGYGFHNEKLYTEKELRDMGAEREVLPLWKRSW